MKKSILILCKTDLSRDPRVLKQIDALSDSYHLTCVGSNKSLHLDVEVDLDLFTPDERDATSNRIAQITKLISKQYKSLYWTPNHKHIYNTLKHNTYDLIICNETESLPIADKIAHETNTPIYCDLHEYYMDDRKTGSFSKAQQKYEKWLLINHVRHVKHFTTVSPEIINLYHQNFNINCSLLDNSCKYYQLTSRPTSKEHIRLVSHGAAIPSRRLELMIEAISALDKRYTLDLYLMDNNPTYKQHLKNMIENSKQISILDAIPFQKIQETINQYDIGLYLLFPTHLNNTFALPNKIFEFIQGRVAVVIGPTPAMADLVNHYNIGSVAQQFSAESLTAAIQSMSIPQIEQCKKNTNLAAMERNSNKNMEIIQNIVKKIIA